MLNPSSVEDRIFQENCINMVAVNDLDPYVTEFYINSSPPDKMASNLANNIFNRILLNKNVWILITKSPIDSNPTLV